MSKTESLSIHESRWSSHRTRQYCCCSHQVPIQFKEGIWCGHCCMCIRLNEDPNELALRQAVTRWLRYGDVLHD